MQIGPYTLDGYNQETNTTYELYGYPSCHPELETETHPHRVDHTYDALYEETLRREHHSREQRYEMVIHSLGTRLCTNSTFSRSV